jgi:hypothetical protein
MWSRMPLDDPIPHLSATQLRRSRRSWRSGARTMSRHSSARTRSVMEIRRGKLDRFSLETLIRYLARLGRRVELRITER